MSLRYVYEQDAAVARFVAMMIPHVGYRGFVQYRAIGVINDNGMLIAGLVFERWNPMAGTIEISGAALPRMRWLTRETLRHIADYVFVKHACQMAIMRVHADDTRTLRQLAAFGFGFVKQPRMYGRDVDGVLCTYTDDDWAASKYNRRAPAPLPLRQKDAA